jgi:tetratricopeptide (TPR) repeat protein
MQKQRFCLLVVAIAMAWGAMQARADEKKGASSPAAMSIEEARSLLRSELKDFLFVSGSGAAVTSVDIKPRKIGLLATEDKRYHWYDFNKFTEVKTQHHLGSRSIELHLAKGDWAEIVLKGYTEESVNRLANAFSVLIAAVAVPPSLDKDPAFQTVVNTYRSSATPPAFPEEARRFKVQAEAAVNEKRFDDAQDCYREALEVAPWWPEGHFNRALVLGEVGDFATATVEMQRYLALMPDAPDARAAQDKIYVWEAKAKESPSGAPATMKTSAIKH